VQYVGTAGCGQYTEHVGSFGMWSVYGTCWLIRDVVSIRNMLAHSGCGQYTEHVGSFAKHEDLSLENAPFETRTTTPTVLTDDFRGFSIPLDKYREVSSN